MKEEIKQQVIADWGSQKIINPYKLKEQEIVNEIIGALCDRGGFDDWWGNIDIDIQNEIKEELENIIKQK